MLQSWDGAPPPPSSTGPQRFDFQHPCRPAQHLRKHGKSPLEVARVQYSLRPQSESPIAMPYSWRSSACVKLGVETRGRRPVTAVNTLALNAEWNGFLGRVEETDDPSNPALILQKPLSAWGEASARCTKRRYAADVRWDSETRRRLFGDGVCEVGSDVTPPDSWRWGWVRFLRGTHIVVL